ncbi:MAG: Acyl-CoA dehydrogenase family er 11 [Pseudonocardiales bacterium]|nr:Acyl-CoA dehydrogenase family er 11 [Pseudonocardiales bacterium]
MGAEITDPDQLHARVEKWLPKLLSLPGNSVSGLNVSALSKPRTGQSNETVLFEASWLQEGQPHSADLVLRLQPRGNQMFLDADVVREGRLVQHLGERNGLSVPPVFVVVADSDLLGAPFFLMGRIEGHVPAGSPSIHLDPWLTSLSPDQRTALMSQAITALAGVHAVDVDSIRPILDPSGTRGTLAADIERLQEWFDWARRGRTFPILESALAAIGPGLGREPSEAVLLWGDPRPGNIIFTETPEVAALLDWEMATIGPAELDVGWWLMMDEFAARGVEHDVLPGFPSRAETVAWYEGAAGRTLQDLDFYQLIAGVKLAITLIPAADSLIARGILPPDTEFAFANVPTQMVARLVGRPEPELSPDYRRLSRMNRRSR